MKSFRGYTTRKIMKNYIFQWLKNPVRFKTEMDIFNPIGASYVFASIRCCTVDDEEYVKLYRLNLVTDEKFIKNYIMNLIRYGEGSHWTHVSTYKINGSTRNSVINNLTRDVFATFKKTKSLLRKAKKQEEMNELFSIKIKKEL